MRLGYSTRSSLTRPSTALAALAVLLLVHFSCTPAGPCSPANCTGCCDAFGRCVAGTLNQACGTNGADCMGCSSARICGAEGICVPRCTPSSCTGCCDDVGDCKTGDALTACGKGGDVCIDCSLLGRDCVSAACSGTGGGSGGSGGGTPGTGGGLSGTGGGTSGTGGGLSGTGGGTGGTGGGTGGGATPKTTYRVFTTSAPVLPAFGGLSAGDSLCNVFASDAGLPGRYIAWLSDSTAGALSRFPAGLDVQWAKVDAGVVFASPARLAATPSSALDRDERGRTLFTGSAWTGTATGGASSGSTCGDWKDSAKTGTFGSVIDPLNWTVGGVPALCTTSRRLFCFQVQ